MKSPAHFLDIPVRSDFTGVVKKLMEDFSAADFNLAQKFASILFDGEAHFGYCLSPWKIDGDTTCVKRRLWTFAVGVETTAQFCKSVGSLLEAKARLHEVVTVGAGFIIYQVDMMIDRMAVGSATNYVFTRERHAGPGMVPFGVELAFGQEMHVADESDVAPARDDGGKQAKRKATVVKCTPGHRRQAVAACNLFSELLFKSPLWHDICANYGLHSLAPQPLSHPEEGEDGEERFEEQFRHQTAALLAVYDLIEYAFCELRRLLNSPQRRDKAGAAGAESLRSKWQGVVAAQVAIWRRSMVEAGNVT